MVRVINTTRGILCVDPPANRQVSGDPVADLLASIDLSKPATADETFRTFLALDIAKQQAAQIERQMRVVAQQRARCTVDLLPEHQGDGKPKYVNEVPDEKWRALERMPAIAARLASGDLRVVGYPSTGIPLF